MKRVLSITLAAAFIAGMAGCNQPGLSPVNSPENTAESSEAKGTETENAETSAEKTEAEKTEFKEMTVIDNESCLIKLTDYRYDELFGCVIGVHVENRTAGSSLMFATEYCGINNIQADPYWASEQPVGASFDDEITISNERLEEIGVAFDDITDLELNFRVYVSDDYSNTVAKETAHIYPYGEDKATKFTREPQESDEVIFDTPEASMTVISYDHDDFWGYEAKTYLVNKTDHEIMFSIDSASINDVEADPYYAESLAPGMCTFSKIAWDDSMLEKNNITSVDKITLKVTAYDSDDLKSDYFVKEQEVTLTPAPLN